MVPPITAAVVASEALPAVVLSYLNVQNVAVVVLRAQAPSAVVLTEQGADAAVAVHPFKFNAKKLLDSLITRLAQSRLFLQLRKGLGSK